jgi:hypothetical protein
MRVTKTAGQFETRLSHKMKISLTGNLIQVASQVSKVALSEKTHHEKAHQSNLTKFICHFMNMQRNGKKIAEASVKLTTPDS